MRALLFGMALVWAAVARAVIVVPDDHPTIQAAVDAAAASDTIYIRSGTYPEAVVIDGKSLVMEGLGGQPVIAPGASAKALQVRGDTTRLELRDVDIVGARIGVLANVGGTLFLERVDISGCTKGAILKSTSLILSDVTVVGSTSFGIRASAAGPSITRLTASNNGADGAKIKNLTRNAITGTGYVQGGAFDDNAKNGLVYIDRSTTSMVGCDASRNGLAGIKLSAKQNFVYLGNNQANDNGTYGFVLRGKVYDEASQIGSGNSATGNGIEAFLIQ